MITPCRASQVAADNRCVADLVLRVEVAGAKLDRQLQGRQS